METLDTEKYIITYSNYFEYNNRVFAYRKKVLFDITTIPKPLNSSNNNGSIGYWINRKWLSQSAIMKTIVREPKQVDVSELQWFEQIKLDEVF